jgi:hypothetical protein
VPRGVGLLLVAGLDRGLELAQLVGVHAGMLGRLGGAAQGKNPQ